eukprot:Hpha_TRINITY_DN15934_c1_g6::TRINITY_DN15934_c1_g6_i1::g.73654::m.73654
MRFGRGDSEFLPPTLKRALALISLGVQSRMGVRVRDTRVDARVDATRGGGRVPASSSCVVAAAASAICLLCASDEGVTPSVAAARRAMARTVGSASPRPFTTTLRTRSFTFSQPLPNSCRTSLKICSSERARVLLLLCSAPSHRTLTPLASTRFVCTKKRAASFAESAMTCLAHGNWCCSDFSTVPVNGAHCAAGVYAHSTCTAAHASRTTCERRSRTHAVRGPINAEKADATSGWVPAPPRMILCSLWSASIRSPHGLLTSIAFARAGASMTMSACSDSPPRSNLTVVAVSVASYTLGTSPSPPPVSGRRPRPGGARDSMGRAQAIRGGGENSILPLPYPCWLNNNKVQKL